MALFSILQQNYLIAIALGAIIIALSSFFVVKTQYQWQLSLLLSIIVSTLVIAFTYGVNAATHSVNERGKWSAVDLEPSGMVVGALIRSGERGVLLYTPDDKSFVLIPWTKVKMVQNKRLNSPLWRWPQFNPPTE